MLLLIPGCVITRFLPKKGRMSENGLQEMSFLAHLEVLRWHIMRALAAILLCMLLAFLSKHVLFHVILFAVSDFCIDMPF